MKSIRYKYVEGQLVNFGPKRVTIAKQKEFLGMPSYEVHWFDKDGNLYKAILKEDEIS